MQELFYLSTHFYCILKDRQMAFNDNDFTGMSIESSEVHNLDLFRFVKKYSLSLSFEQQDSSN